MFYIYIYIEFLIINFCRNGYLFRIYHYLYRRKFNVCISDTTYTNFCCTLFHSAFLLKHTLDIDNNILTKIFREKTAYI